MRLCEYVYTNVDCSIHSLLLIEDWGCFWALGDLLLVWSFVWRVHLSCPQQELDWLQAGRQGSLFDKKGREWGGEGCLPPVAGRQNLQVVILGVWRICDHVKFCLFTRDIDGLVFQVNRYKQDDNSFLPMQRALAWQALGAIDLVRDSKTLLPNVNLDALCLKVRSTIVRNCLISHASSSV